MVTRIIMFLVRLLCVCVCVVCVCCFVFFQAEDGIRDLVRSRGLGDVYKRQIFHHQHLSADEEKMLEGKRGGVFGRADHLGVINACLLYTSDAADERSSVDLGGRRIIKKNKRKLKQKKKKKKV